MSEFLMTAALTVDDIYPVGSIYMSVNAVDPARLFGGTWERIKEKFLLGAGDTHPAGRTGGEFDHKLKVDEIPAHSHKTAKGAMAPDSPIHFNALSTYQSEEAIDPGNRWYATTNESGGSQPHNNTPPYLAVYIWQRTA
nr:MAG TPA: baseplate wedge protein [Caudoviricetes sp.]